MPKNFLLTFFAVVENVTSVINIQFLPVTCIAAAQDESDCLSALGFGNKIQIQG